MKIKYLFLSTVLAAGLMFTACGNDKAAQEAEAQRIADSIRVADSIAAVEAEAARLAEEEAAAAAAAAEAEADSKGKSSGKTSSKTSTAPATPENVATHSNNSNVNAGQSKSTNVKAPSGPVKKNAPSQLDNATRATQATSGVAASPNTTAKAPNGKSGTIAKKPVE